MIQPDVERLSRGRTNIHRVEAFTHREVTDLIFKIQRLCTGCCGEIEQVRRGHRQPTVRVKLLHKVGLYTLFKHTRSEEHTSELQSRFDLVCRLLLEKKNIH